MKTKTNTPNYRRERQIEGKTKQKGETREECKGNKEGASRGRNYGKVWEEIHNKKAR